MDHLVYKFLLAELGDIQHLVGDQLMFVDIKKRNYEILILLLSYYFIL